MPHSLLAIMALGKVKGIERGTKASGENGRPRGGSRMISEVGRGWGKECRFDQITIRILRVRKDRPGQTM